MAIACTNPNIINLKNNDYHNVYYVKSEHLSLKSGLVQNLKNKFMAIIELEKSSQTIEEKNIRKYKSLENIDNEDGKNNILIHHKSLENICDTLDDDVNSSISISLPMNESNTKLDSKCFINKSINGNIGSYDFATIQSKFGKPIQGIRKRHMNKIESYKSNHEYNEEHKALSNISSDVRGSKVQQIKNIFSKKLKSSPIITPLIVHEIRKLNFDDKINGQHESHESLVYNESCDTQIVYNESIVDKPIFPGKSIVKSSSGIYFYYNNESQNKVKEHSENSFSQDLLVFNQNNLVKNNFTTKNHCKVAEESHKSKVIGIASAEVQTKAQVRNKINNIPKDFHDGTYKNNIHNNSHTKKIVSADPEGYWRVTRDLVHKIRAKGRSYRFENGKRQELPTTIFLPVIKPNTKDIKPTNGNPHVNLHTLKNSIDERLLIYYNDHETKENILPSNMYYDKAFINSQAGKNMAYSIVAPIPNDYKKSKGEQDVIESVYVKGASAQLPSKTNKASNSYPQHNINDTKRFKIQINDYSSDLSSHAFSNDYSCQENTEIEGDLDDIEDEMTEDDYRNLSQQIQVFGAYIKLERNCFLRASRKKCLRITFDTAEPLTFEYPSEQSLLEHEFENEDVQARIHAFNNRAAEAAAEAERLKEPKGCLKQQFLNVSRPDNKKHQRTPPRPSNVPNLSLSDPEVCEVIGGDKVSTQSTTARETVYTNIGLTDNTSKGAQQKYPMLHLATVSVAPFSSSNSLMTAIASLPLPPFSHPTNDAKEEQEGEEGGEKEEEEKPATNESMESSASDRTLANFRPKNFRHGNPNMVISFVDSFTYNKNKTNHQTAFGGQGMDEGTDNGTNNDTDANGTNRVHLLHTHPVPADDIATSKWSMTTAHYSDLLF